MRASSSAEEIEYDDGPIPPGYRLETRSQRPLLLAGPLVLGARLHFGPAPIGGTGYGAALSGEF